VNLSGGGLSKVLRGKPTNDVTTLPSVQEISAVSDGCDDTPTQVPLEWLLPRPGVRAECQRRPPHGQHDGKSGWYTTSLEGHDFQGAAEPCQGI
jgi:hypothetical protein